MFLLLLVYLIVLLWGESMCVRFECDFCCFGLCVGCGLGLVVCWLEVFGGC